MDSKTSLWYAVYVHGETPWDSGRPDPELVSLVDSGLLKGKRALDVGSGTGTNVVYLSEKGFDAMGIDISNVAINIAVKKAKGSNVNPRFFVADVLDLSFLKGKFDLVFDRGCFHHQKRGNWPNYATQISSKLKKGGYLLLLAICDRDRLVSGPNKVSHDDIVNTFSKDFNIPKIDDKELDDNIRPLAYVALMRKNDLFHICAAGFVLVCFFYDP
ncbi:MAG: class I SAM-dependent methyltransferase [archaeon]